ncbi:hypothetical protein U1Q18_037665, partial [Sarracenia purpurea var. burkii]
SLMGRLASMADPTVTISPFSSRPPSPNSRPPLPPSSRSPSQSQIWFQNSKSLLISHLRPFRLTHLHRVSPYSRTSLPTKHSRPQPATTSSTPTAVAVAVHRCYLTLWFEHLSLSTSISLPSSISPSLSPSISVRALSLSLPDFTFFPIDFTSVYDFWVVGFNPMVEILSQYSTTAELLSTQQHYR